MFISRRPSAHRASCRIAVLVLAAMLAPAVLGPGRAAAQEEKVGVVTVLRGQALVARPMIQQPLSLKFKDDVFVRDRVETRADSLVRVLLGGRALVTVRELSSFTASEGPNQVVIDLLTGKAAVGVAPSLLRPGETIEVRTPNAVAGIRGSLLVVTVVQVGSDFRTTFEAPQASKPITVSSLGTPSVSIDLNANQSVNVTGMGAQTQVGPVTNMTATQAAAAARTADAPRPREQEATSPMAPEIAAASIAQATQLVVALQGPPTPDPLFQEATINAAQGGGATGNLASSISATSQLQVNAFVADQALATQENQPLPPSPPPSPPPPPPLCAGCVVIENQTLRLPPGQSIITFTGTSTWPATIPVVRIDQSTVSGDSTFVEAAPGSVTTAAGPLFLMTNSTIETGGSVVHVGSARLDAAPTPALLAFDPSIVNAGTGVIRLDGGSSLGVKGSLLTAQSTSFRAGDPTTNTSPFLGIFDGSSLEQTGASGAPLLVFDASPVNSAGALISVQGSPSIGNPSRLTLDGPLFRAVNGTQLTMSGDALSISDGGQFTGGSASAALIDLDNAQLTTGPSFGSVLQVGGFGADGVNPATANLGGTLLNAGTGSRLSLTGGFIQAANGGQVNVAPGVTSSLITLHGGSHTLGASAIGIFSGGQFTGGSASAALIELDSSAQLTGAGSVLRADGVGVAPATANLGGALLNAGTGSTLNLTGGFIQAANGGQVNVGPGATNSLVTLHGGSHTLGSDAIGVFSGGQFTGGSASAALIGLDSNAQLTGAGSVLRADGVRVAPATANLGGALLNAGTGSTLNLTGGFIQAANGGQVNVGPGATNSLITLHGGSHTLGSSGIGVFSGGQFTGGSASAPLIDLDNAQLTGARSVLEADGVGGATGGTPATATLGGALLNVAGGSTLSLTGGFIQASNGGQVNVAPGATNSLITLHGGSHTLGSDAIGIFSGGQFTGGSASAALIGLDSNAQLTGAGSVLRADGVGAATGGIPATATLGGALLNAAGGSTLSLTGGFIQAANGGQVNMAPGATNSLITLHGGSHTLGSDAIGIFSGGQFTGGSASAALIDLDNAQLTGLNRVLQVGGFGADGVTPATANLGGALLNAGNGSALNLTGGFIEASSGGQVNVAPGVTNSLITLHGGSHTLGPSAISILDGGQFTGGSANAPLIDLDNAQLTGAGSVLRADGVGVAPATANLGGALLNAGTGSTLNLTGGFIEASSGGQVNVDAGTTNSLITLHGGSHTLGSSGIGVFSGGQFTGGSASAPLIDLDNAQLTGARSVLEADGVGGATGGTPATANLGGALLNAGTGSTLNLTGGFIQASNGGQVNVAPGATNSLITLHGGNHTLGGDAIVIFSGGQFTGGSASAALIGLDSNAQLTGAGSVLRADGVGAATGGIPATATLGGALLNVAGGSTLSLTGGFIQASNGGQVNVAPGATNSLITLHGGNHTLGGDAIGIFSGGQFTGGSASAALIDLDNAQLTGLNRVLQVGGFGADGVTPATANLGGALLNAGNGSALNLTGGFIEASSGGQVNVAPGVTNSLITLHGGSHTLGPSAISILDGGQFTGGSANAPLIDLDNAQLTGAGSVLRADGVGVAPATANLGGALLNAGTGSTLNLTGGFIQASSGGQVNVDAGTTNSLITLHGGSHTLGSSGIGVFSGGQFTGGSASAPLIDLDNAQLTGARSVLEADGVGVTPATANLRGALLNAGTGSTLNLTGGFIRADNGAQVNVAPGVTNSLITLHGGNHTLGGDAIGIFSGGQFTGGSASAALIDLDSAHLTTTGFLFGNVLQVGRFGADGFTPARANLRGALLNAGTGSTLSLNSNGFIQVFDGGEVNVDPSATNSLITLHGGSRTTLGLDVISIFSDGQFTGGSASAALIDLDNAQLTGAGSVLRVEGDTGGATTMALLRGALLNAANGSTLNLTRGFIQASSGAQVTVVDPDSLVTLQGGSHTIAPAVPTGSGPSMFDLSGRPANVTVDNGVVVNADRPLRHEGPLLETNGAKIGESTASQRLLRLDSALLEASLPLLKATNNSLIRTATDAIDLSVARLTIAGDLIQLNASRFDVVSGALASVRNRSSLMVGGNLVTLMNGSTLNLLNGPVLNVSNSQVRITGALIGFGGTGGNVVNITNNLCASGGGCQSFAGLRVSGAVFIFGPTISVTNPIANPTLGTINLSPNAAHISVSGGFNTRVTIGQ